MSDIETIARECIRVSNSFPYGGFKAVTAVLQKHFGQDQEKGGKWYCRNCGYLSGSRVTYYETCDTCHIPVEWHDLDKMTAFDEAEKNIQHAGNLLAVMHRDGGHYISEHGFEKACKDAEQVRHDLVKKLSSAQEAMKKVLKDLPWGSNLRGDLEDALKEIGDGE